ncbi:MAG: short-chain fatty acid transporter [Actinophytocola sp.]|nr:short-chain fatty acid transporter [Actinophytocola sp.]
MRLIARTFSRIAERYMPDAFIFLVLITVVVLALGIVAGSSPREVLDYWGEGYFGILEFTAQSTLILVLGFALANTPPVHRALRWFTTLPRNEVQVILLTVLVMMICSWISWGFGLIAGGIVAREMGVAHRGKVHYPLLVAATYSGFIVWHAGYGGAIPQLIATPAHFLEDSIGIVGVGQTIFSAQTLVIVGALAIVIPVLMVLMRPSAGDRVHLPESVLRESEKLDATRAENAASHGDLSLDDGPGTTHKPVLAERLERSRFFTLIFGVLGLLFLASYYAGSGQLNINMVIYSFTVAGLLLAPNVRQYLGYVMGGAQAAYGIILQFPFYGAIMGVMTGTGLVTVMANFFVNISTADTLPFWSFVSGGVVNIFVPSGGGQWAVQGPIVIDAALQLGADPAATAMGVAWGDAWTNMIQPFWAIPLLAIAGLGIRQIMGYTAVALIVSGVVIGGGLLLL